MKTKLCVNCFHVHPGYEVCPYCGYVDGEPAKELFQLCPGTILAGRYIIGEAIGFGGFGIIYRAFDTNLAVVMAIKEFYPATIVHRAEGERRIGVFSVDKTEEFQRRKSRFLEEARSLALFSQDKDIVYVSDFFEDNGTAYYVMEFIESPVLKHLLNEKGKLEEAEAVECICAVLQALSKIHANGIIHGDISPDNIFYIRPGEIKLFDFGAAKLQNAEIINEDILIKPGYSPPEQYHSDARLNAQTDVYAAGAVLYQLITGVKPEEAPTRMIRDELVSPKAMGAKVSPQVNKAIMKALSLKPEKRFSSAMEFRDALLHGDSRRFFG